MCVERALQIERKLMSGARYRPAAGASPLDVIAEVEELLRRLLKGMATGELTGDLRSAADEVLLSEGMQAANAAPPPSMGETAEWRIPDPVSDEEQPDLSAIADGHVEGTPAIEIRKEKTATRIVVDDVELPDIVSDEPETTEATTGAEPEPNTFAPQPEDAEHDAKADWFASADGELEWPAFASPRRGRPDEHRELDEEASDRVRYLFPVPDATDWDVGELSYERRHSS